MKWRQGIYVFLIAVFSPVLAWTQNLVSNPGFEQYRQLPDGAGQWYQAEGWTNVGEGRGFPAPTPDFLYRAASGQARLPHSSFGTIEPQSGDGVMGATVWSPRHSDFREYLSQSLSQPLEVGVMYTFSFFVSNGNQGSGTAGGYGIGGLGIYFSEETPAQTGATPILVKPQLAVQEVLYSVTWRQLRFTFEADKPYRFFTVGNFEDDGHTLVRHFFNTTFPTAYYFFDSFDLRVYDPDETIGEELQAPVSDTLAQGPAAAAFFPAETAESTCPVYLPNCFSPDGNGVNDCFELYTPCPLLALDIQIFDRAGQLIFSSDDPNFRWDGYYNGTPVEKGVYFYVIKSTLLQDEKIREAGWRGTISVISP